MDSDFIKKYIAMPNVDSLTEVARIIGATEEQLEAWKTDSPSLRNGPPFAIGEVVWDLLTANRLAAEKIVEISKNDGPNELQSAFASQILTDSILEAEFGDFFDSILEDPSLSNVLIQGDTERFGEALKMSGNLRPKNWQALTSNDKVAIAIARPKTAALFFDRIWTLDRDIPGEIGFRIHTVEEKVALGLFDGVINKLAAREKDPNVAEKKIEKASEFLTSPEVEVQIAKAYSALLIPSVEKIVSHPVQTFFANEENMKASYEPGSTTMVIAVIESLGLIDESSLTWNHVRAIREDQGSVGQLRRMLHWIDKDMSGKSLGFIQDEINLRITEYEDAAKKHGIKLLTGAFGTLLDVKLWNTLLGTIIGCALEKHSVAVAGLAAGLTLQGTRVAFETMNLNRDLKIARDTHPVAFLHNLNKVKPTEGI